MKGFHPMWNYLHFASTILQCIFGYQKATARLTIVMTICHKNYKTVLEICFQVSNDLRYLSYFASKSFEMFLNLVSMK